MALREAQAEPIYHPPPAIQHVCGATLSRGTDAKSRGAKQAQTHRIEISDTDNGRRVRVPLSKKVYIQHREMMHHVQLTLHTYIHVQLLFFTHT